MTTLEIRKFKFKIEKEQETMKRNYVLRTMLMITVMIGVAVYVNGFVSFNGIPPAFDSSYSKGMEALTIKGTSLFLRSNADVFLLLNEVEEGYPHDLDFVEALSLTESAILKLTEARTKYLDIMNNAEKSGYVSSMVSRLQQFNYGNFARTRGLNLEIMKKVQSYLKDGNVTGLYAENIENIDNILILLQGIKEELKEGISPGIDRFWSLLQQYSNAILMGNYATVVFNNL